MVSLYLKDNLTQAKCDLGKMFANFLNKNFLNDDTGALTTLQLLPWIYNQCKKRQYTEQVIVAFLVTFHFVRKGNFHSCDIFYIY